MEGNSEDFQPYLLMLNKVKSKYNETKNIAFQTIYAIYAATSKEFKLL